LNGDIEKIFYLTLNEILKKIKAISNCQSNAIRLKENGDYPFLVYDGFINFFIKKENSLLGSKKKFNPDQKKYCDLECVCGKIINEKFNPSFPFFSKNGSFWTNSTTELLLNFSKEQREFIGETRNMCHFLGYESLALIPIKVDNETIGLVHIADCRKNMFSELKILEFEKKVNEFSEIIKNAIEVKNKLEKLA
jgi:hypothetical protein